MLRFRVATVIAGLLLATVFSAAGFADSIPALSIDAASSTVSVGNSVTLDVNISNVTDLYGFQFDLGFTPGTLSASSIAEGSFLSLGGPTLFLEGSIDNATGIISFTADTLFGPGPGIDGNGTLAILTLTGLTEGVSSIELSNVILLDSNLNPIDASLLNVSVEVTPGTVATPEPGTLVLLFSALVCVTVGKIVLGGEKSTFAGN
jgi:general secretion pathway protein D